MQPQPFRSALLLERVERREREREERQKTSTAVSPSHQSNSHFAQYRVSSLGKEEYQFLTAAAAPLTPEVISLFCQDDGHDRLYAGPFPFLRGILPSSLLDGSIHGRPLFVGVSLAEP